MSVCGECPDIDMNINIQNMVTNFWATPVDTIDLAKGPLRPIGPLATSGDCTLWKAQFLSPKIDIKMETAMSFQETTTTSDFSLASNRPQHQQNSYRVDISPTQQWQQENLKVRIRDTTVFFEALQWIDVFR